MGKSTHRWLPILCLCSLSYGFLRGQDSAWTVVLSPRVGGEIDRAERDYYRLFGQIVGYQRAVMCQRQDSTYFLRIEYQPDTETIRDTIVNFPEVQVLMLAEKINHFEGLQEGTYQMGTDPPRITALDGRPILITLSKGPLTTETERIPRTIDKLPLSPESIDESLIDDGGGTWIGLGVSTYAPDYSGLASMYRGLERTLAAQGYPIAYRNPSFSSSSVFSLNFKLRLSSNTSLLLEGGTNLGEGVDFNSATASILFHIPVFQGKPWHPFAGVGVGHYRIKAEEKYLSPLGGGAVLDALLVEAANFGYSITGGFEGGRTILWSVSATYLEVPVVKQTKWGSEGTIDMSSFMLAARLSFLW